MHLQLPSVLTSAHCAKGKQMSQEEVAHLAGIHVTYLSGIERGRRNPSLNNIRRLAFALGASVKDLFSFEDELT